MSAPITDHPKYNPSKQVSSRWALSLGTFLLGMVLAGPAWAQCGHDPGNGDIATATPFGGCLQASFCLDFADDVDFYRIDPQFPTDMVFETLGSTDTFMELLNSAGQVVDQDDDDGQDSNAKISYHVEGGYTYYIKVRGYSASTTGAYDLLVSGCCGADPFNNDFFHTTPYSGALISANIDCPGDVDIYRFTATDTGTYTFDFNTADSIVWALYDSGNMQTTTYSNVASREVELAAGEGLHIVVEGHYTDTIGAYSLEHTRFVGGGGCGDDPGNDDTGSATDLGHSCGITAAEIDCLGDLDYYRFTAPSSDSYNFYTAGGVDTYINLFDHSGAPLTSDDDSGQDTNASVVYSLNQGSVYYIAVNEYGNNGMGVYHLYVSGCPTGCGDDPGNDDAGNATALSNCGTTQAGIDCAGDDDYYVFQAPADSIYTWTLSPTNRGAMILYAADAATEIGSGQNTVSATMISGDTVYLWVSAATATDTFNYDLNLSGCTGGGCGNDPGNDDIPNATAIGSQCGTTQGSIDCLGDVDFYQFIAPESGTFTIETTGSTDTYLRLYLDDRLVTLDDNSGTGNNAKIESDLIFGRTYNIPVHVYDSDETGDYDLVISGCTGGCGDDPGDDSSTTAGTYSHCGTIQQDIDCPGDVDWHRFQAVDDSIYTWTLSPTNRGGMILYAADATTEIDAGQNSVSTTMIGGDAVYIVVLAASPTDIFTYSLITSGCPAGGCGDDPGNDDTASATDLGSQCGITGAQIDCEGDYDFYLFTAPSSDSYNFYTAGGTDTYLTLYDHTGTPLTTDDDSAQDTNASIVYSLTQGSSYYIAVNEFGDNATGSYHLNVSGCPTGCGNDPGNDDIPSATDLGSQCGITGAQIDCEGDYDFYLFTAPSSDSYNFYTAGGTDTYLTLYDHTGSQLISDDDSAQDTNASIVYSLTQGSSYFIAVNEFGDNATGSYHLNVSGCPTGCGNDPGNDDIGSATDLGTSCGSKSAAFDCPADMDFYRFTAPRTGDFTLETTGSSDTLALLMDDTGASITTDHDSGADLNARITHTLTQGLVYFIRITEFNNDDTGDYTLVVSGCTTGGCGNDPGNDTLASATDLGTTCGTYPAAIDCADDEDFYAFTAPIAGTYSFSAGAGAAGLKLMDPAAVIIDSDTFSVEGILAQGQLVFLRISAFTADDTFSYTLAVTGCSPSGCGTDPGNDDITSSTDLGNTCGNTTAAFDCVGDFDFYEFTAPTTGEIKFETTGSSDTFILLMNDMGGTIVDNDDGGQGQNARVVYTLTQGSTYFLSVSEYNNDDTGDYTLVISGCDSGSCDNDPGNDDPASATNLGNSCGTTHAAFDCTGDIDYYRFTPDVSGTFTLETRGSMDTLISLEDTTGSELDSDDDSGADRNAQISTSLDAGTTYFIRIGEFGFDGLGSYDFFISGCTGSSPDAFSTIVTSAAKVQGAAGTNWSSDLVILNNGDQTTLVTISMWLRDQANPTPATTSRTLAPGELWKETDVLGSRFGISDGAAALHIGADQPLGVASRTFNDTSVGTYGQFIAGVSESSAVQTGTRAVVSGLTENPAFRTNLGLVNPTADQIVVHADFYSSTGNPLGTRSYTVPAFGYIQKNRVLTSLGVGSQSEAWATLQSNDGPFFSFCSVVDNTSGDPVYRPGGTPPSEAGTSLMAGLAKLAGAAGTNWLSDVTILNSGTHDYTIGLHLWMRDANNDIPLQRTKVIPAGSVFTMADILAGTFGLSEGASALVLSDAEGLIAGCRTYNQVSTGTFGQYIPAMWGSEAVNRDRSGFLIMIQENNQFRTNLGLINTSDVSTDVVLTLIDENGLQIGASKTVGLSPRGVVQLNRVARQFTNIVVPAASLELKLSATADDGTVHAFASVVDQMTGDPIFESVTVTAAE